MKDTENSPSVNHSDARFFPIIFGIIHAVIDASCVTVIFSSIPLHGLTPFAGFYVILTYDLLAFAGQAFLGLMVDYLRLFKGILSGGIILTVFAVIFLRIEPITAMLFAGIGNACFHVGAGALSLHVNPGRATPPGIFVAPGALGLALGTWMGKSGLDFTWALLPALAVSFFAALYFKKPEVPYRKTISKPNISKPALILLLLLFSIIIRSFVGLGGSYECPKFAVVSFGLAFAAFAGKASGGIVSDRLGWIETSVCALLISAPLIAFGNENHVMVTIGMFLFQMTMPVTLVAVASTLPGRPAFAFGLTCLALIIGALPTFFREVKIHYNPHFFFALIILSTIAIYVGLRLLKKEVPMKFK